MTNAEAAAKMVAALKPHLTDADQPLVAAVLSLAQVVDEYPAEDRLWGRYQAAVRALREVRPDGDDDEIAKLVAAIRGGASVVDAADKPANARRGGLKGR